MAVWYHIIQSYNYVQTFLINSGPKLTFCLAARQLPDLLIVSQITLLGHSKCCPGPSIKCTGHGPVLASIPVICALRHKLFLTAIITSLAKLTSVVQNMNFFAHSKTWQSLFCTIKTDHPSIPTPYKINYSDNTRQCPSFIIFYWIINLLVKSFSLQCLSVFARPLQYKYKYYT